MTKPRHNGRGDADVETTNHRQVESTDPALHNPADRMLARGMEVRDLPHGLVAIYKVRDEQLALPEYGRDYPEPELDDPTAGGDDQ